MSDPQLLEHVRDLVTSVGREHRAHLDGIRREMTAGFTGVNARLDRVNGRLDKHGDRLSKVENGDPFLHQRATDPLPVKRVHSRSDDGKAITRRDVNVVIATLGAVASVLAFFAWLVPLLKGLFS